MVVLRPPINPLIIAEMSCYAKPAKNPTDKTPAGREEGVIPLSKCSVSVRSRFEVTITHTPSTSNACETHAQPVEKFIASLALSGSADKKMADCVASLDVEAKTWQY